MVERLLVLGGSAEARELAGRVHADMAESVSVVTSFAGRKRRRAAVAGEVRGGGFGGTRALADYLVVNGVRWLIDASHPFAEQISANAHDACVLAGVPRLTLRRPTFEPPSNARWLVVDSLVKASEILPRVAKRAFLAIGRQGAAFFTDVAGVHMVVRVIDNGPLPLRPESHTVIVARPPYSEEDERRLFREHAIDTLVARDAGGSPGEAKLRAAAELGIRMILVEPPLPEPGPLVSSVDDAIVWLRERVGDGI